MFRSLMFTAVAALLLGGGWIVGSIYPAPSSVTDRIIQRARGALELAKIDAQKLETLRGQVSAEDFKKITDNAAVIASQSGKALIVERDAGPVQDESGFSLAAMDQASAPPPSASEKPAASGAKAKNATSAPPTAGSSATLLDQVRLCPRMTISNRPATDPNGVLAGDPRRIDVNGAVLMLNPTGGGCLASGFGPRGQKVHKGLDYHSPIGVDIFAAGDGVILEKKYRPDFGNMILIDHGGGVYTRYGHLSSFDSSLDIGSKVKLGQRLGLMGNTADYPIPIHLHLELLLGDIANPKGSFGLTPRSPFDFIKKG
jgi:murein DD-endopeptidase MepM/ murein hydrolase activator NlpD